jgi:hypothetical protein
MFRESIAISKAYAEARAPLDENELLDEIVAAKPGTDHTKYRSAEELRDNGLQYLTTRWRCLRARQRLRSLTATGTSSRLAHKAAGHAEREGRA